MGNMCGRTEPGLVDIEDLPSMAPSKSVATEHMADNVAQTSSLKAVALNQNNIQPSDPCHPSKPARQNSNNLQEDASPRIATVEDIQPTTVQSRKRTDCGVKEAYKLGKTLGTGGFSIVKLAVDRKTGEEYACKIMALPEDGEETNENSNTREDIFKEIDILCSLKHENVIYLKEYFEEQNKVYLITELLTGGELLDAVVQRGTYSEADARLCTQQLLSGIEYLHSKHVVHRDLKLENLLLASPNDITKVKIADFGLAKRAVENQMQTICGTPQYVAPEVIQGTPGLIYGPICDMWSVGVILFILLGGYPPFWSESEPELFNQIRKAAYSFNDPVWNHVSDKAKDLIKKLLVADPKNRLTAKQALQHPWITGHVSSEPLLANTMENMKKHLRSRLTVVDMRNWVQM